MARTWVGVSGWRYASWRGDFYPAGLVQRRELEYVAARMSSVELNGSFYSLQRPSTYRRIAEQVPAGVPGGREGKSVRHPHAPTARGGDRAGQLLRRRACSPWATGSVRCSGSSPATWSSTAPPWRGSWSSCPATTAAVAALAARHDDRLAADRAVTEPEVDAPVRHALEPRHPSFGEPEALRLLRDQGVALVVSDSPGSWPRFEEDTADFRYVRLHGHTELYAERLRPGVAGPLGRAGPRVARRRPGRLRLLRQRRPRPRPPRRRRAPRAADLTTRRRAITPARASAPAPSAGPRAGRRTARAAAPCGSARSAGARTGRRRPRRAGPGGAARSAASPRASRRSRAGRRRAGRGRAARRSASASGSAPTTSAARLWSVSTGCGRARSASPRTARS